MTLSLAGCGAAPGQGEVLTAHSWLAADAVVPLPRERTVVVPEVLPSDVPPAVEDRLKAAYAGPRQPSFSQPLAPRAETRAIILMYHSIDRGRTRRTVYPWSLEEQILRLREHGVEIVRLAELVDFLEGRVDRLPRKVAVLSFDDGEASFLRYAFPVLLRHRAPFALGIISRAASLRDNSLTLSWAQIRAIHASGLCDIASHGHDHLGVATLEPPRMRRELYRSRELIERHTGVRPDVFVYPLGSTSARAVREVREAGYRAALVAVGSTIDQRAWPYKLPRFEMDRNTSLKAMITFFEAPVAPGPPKGPKR